MSSLRDIGVSGYIVKTKTVLVQHRPSSTLQLLLSMIPAAALLELKYFESSILLLPSLPKLNVASTLEQGKQHPKL